MRTKMTEVTHEKPFDLSSKSKRIKHIKKKNERKRQVKKKKLPSITSPYKLKDVFEKRG